MNLNQAIKTGKPFRRPNWKSKSSMLAWVKKSNTTEFMVFTDTGKRWTPHAEDVSAKDFVTKDDEARTVRVSRNQNGSYLVKVTHGAIQPGDSVEFTEELDTDDEDADIDF